MVDLMLSTITTKEKEKQRRCLAKFMALIVVMASQVYAYLQTHEVAYIEYIQLLYTNYTSIKWFFKDRSKKITRRLRFSKRIV